MCSGSAEDSIEHYCRCPVVSRVAHSFLHMQYPAEEALNVWTLNTKWVDTPEVITCVALLEYGVFNALNSIKHHGISSESQAYNCIVQHCKQGVMGHVASSKVLGNCWRRPLRAWI
jgi:hypothetical protein